MASQMNQETIKIVEKAEYLGRTVRTHKSQVSAKLDQVYGPAPAVGEGEAPIRNDWEGVQDSNETLLARTVQEVRASAQGHRLNLVKASQFRVGRRGVIGDIRKRHGSLKLSILATYGPEKLEVVALNGRLAKKHLTVREECQIVVDRMLHPGVLHALGDPLADHIHLSMESLAAGMSRDLKRFEDIYGQLADMKKILDLSLVAKNQAQERLRRVYTNVARMQEGMFRLAGMDELADRIRLTIPARPKKQTDEASGLEEASGEEAAPNTMKEDVNVPDIEE